MISVIIPTMWRIEFENQFEIIHNIENVKEIILINNNTPETPTWVNAKKYEKLIEIKPHSNIFVNPAWNLGATISKYENIMLHSDDVVADNYNHIMLIDEYLNQKPCIIGVGLSCFSSSIKENTNLILTDISNKPRNLDWGCSIFMKKKNYKNIPKEYLIWRGDDFLIDLHDKRKCPVYSLEDINLQNSKHSLTSDRPEFSWKEREFLGYVDALQEYLKDEL